MKTISKNCETLGAWPAPQSREQLAVLIPHSLLKNACPSLGVPVCLCFLCWGSPADGGTIAPAGSPRCSPSTGRLDLVVLLPGGSGVMVPFRSAPLLCM